MGRSRAALLLCLLSASALALRVHGAAGLAAQCSEEQALQVVQGGGAAAEPVSRDDVALAMQRGWWQVARTLVERARDAGVDVSTPVYQQAAAIRTHLKELTELLQRRRETNSIAPAFQWAQSADSIFLNVKFSHKWDTPATLDCEPSNVTVGERVLHLEADCPKSNKRFELRLELLREVQRGNVSWASSSVGRVNLVVKKGAEEVWQRLLRSRQKPGNMHVWWSMKERYEAELDALEDGVRRPSAAGGAGGSSSGGGDGSGGDKGGADGGGAAAEGRGAGASRDEL